MKLVAFITLVIVAIQIVNAHTVFTTLFVNDVGQGDATCVRMNMTPSNSTNPINDLASNDMVCGFDGTVGVARVCPVSQGSKLTFLFREWADASQPGAIDISHKGPCAVYMKAVASAVKDQGYGDGWFKIWDSGYDNANSQWCTEKLIKDNGLLSVNIPAIIAGGYYLVRPELLALHQADKTPPNPQFYTGCAQIFIPSGGSAVPATVSIPGHVSAGDKSVTFNIYKPTWPYPMPGPPVFKSGASSKADFTAVTVQTEGLVPAGCVVVNGNWCGIELDSYNSEAGCWNASQNCFAQTTKCYASAAPTGDEGCRTWEAKCNAVQASCSTGNFNGPPNGGKVLTPPSKAYSIPPAEGKSFSVIPDATTKSITQANTQTMSTVIAKGTPNSMTVDAMTKSVTKPVTQTTSTAIGVFTPITGVSTDGSCGASAGYTCVGSKFGDCCSQYNWCGSAQTYCGQGCQGDYGKCGTLYKRQQAQHLRKRLFH